MATGYTVTGRGDLDVLFAARVSAAAANVGFLSNGGVDLAQRFEPRGATPAIPNVSFQKAGADLATIFKDIAAAGTATALSMTAGTHTESTPARTNNGYATSTVIAAGSPAIGSVTVSTIGSNTLAGLYWTDDDVAKVVFSAGSAPADADTTWQRVDINGTWQGGVTETRSLTRSAGTTSTSGVRRIWTFLDTIVDFASGNVYAVTFIRL